MPASAASQHKLAILFVEDDRDTREASQLLWAAADRDIVGCASAEEALDELSRRHFDLVITDISLPGMSGTDFARRVSERWSDAELVFCSGYLYERGVEVAGRRLRSLLKPIEPDTFARLLSELRARKQPSGAHS